MQTLKINSNPSLTKQSMYRDYSALSISFSASKQSHIHTHTTLHIKNMVSLRCIIVVKAELEKLRLSYSRVELGEAFITSPISEQNHLQLKTALMASGLELIEDKKSILIEKIRTVIVEMVHFAEHLPVVKYSAYISEKLHYDYTYLSNLFTEMKGISIQEYIINHKIEKVKELLLNTELSITQISYKLQYSSVGHLCHQFKKVTGLTPGFFRSNGERTKLIALDNV